MSLFYFLLSIFFPHWLGPFEVHRKFFTSPRGIQSCIYLRKHLFSKFLCIKLNRCLRFYLTEIFPREKMSTDQVLLWRLSRKLFIGEAFPGSGHCIGKFPTSFWKTIFKVIMCKGQKKGGQK